MSARRLQKKSRSQQYQRVLEPLFSMLSHNLKCLCSIICILQCCSSIYEENNIKGCHFFVLVFILCTSVLILRRTVFVTCLIAWAFISSRLLIGILALLQLIYFAYIWYQCFQKYWKQKRVNTKISNLANLYVDKFINF